MKKVGLFSFLAAIVSCSDVKTPEQARAIAVRDSLDRIVAVARVDSTLRAQKLKRLVDSEEYVSGFVLQEREGSNAATYIATCKLLEECAADSKVFESDGEKAVRGRAKALQRKIKALRVNSLPTLRKWWAKAAAESLWEEDIEVKVSGAGNSTLELTGVVFASNANIKAAQESLGEGLGLLRFKRVKYRWYSGQAGFQYYDMGTPPDASL